MSVCFLVFETHHLRHPRPSLFRAESHRTNKAEATSRVIRYWSMLPILEAVNFVQRCDSNKRVDLYVECGEWVMAGKEPKEHGDRARPEKLRSSCSNSLIARELDQIASTMK